MGDRVFRGQLIAESQGFVSVPLHASVTGTVTAIDPGIDEGSRSMKLRATLANADFRLRPGMFAEIQTIIAEAKPVLTLPATAVSVNTYGNFVFVVNKGADGKLMVKRTAVELGDSIDGRVIVTSLEAGIEVVRTGLVKLRDGIPVKVDNQVKLDDATISGE